MATHLDLGAKGEELACKKLQEDGYEILARNYRSGKAEIDVIARRDKTILFIEVKTRSEDKRELPEKAVNPRKQVLILEAAENFMNTQGKGFMRRFDIISIVKKGSDLRILHLKDAFY